MKKNQKKSVRPALVPTAVRTERELHAENESYHTALSEAIERHSAARQNLHLIPLADTKALALANDALLVTRNALIAARANYLRLAENG